MKSTFSQEFGIAFLAINIAGPGNLHVIHPQIKTTMDWVLCLQLQLVESMDVKLANTECLNYEVTVLGFWYLRRVLEPIPVEPREECTFPLFTLQPSPPFCTLHPLFPASPLLSPFPPL